MTVADSCESLVAAAAHSLHDPEGRHLASQVRWWSLPGLPTPPRLRWPVVVTGNGPPLLLLHGFDSSFLEFRRLVPLLAATHTLIIPDLFGFGFTPRPANAPFGPAGVLAHLEALLDALPLQLGLSPSAPPLSGGIGVIGASMGGAVAMELARRRPVQVSRLLLLDPAGLTGRPRALPAPLANLGVRFLALPWVRRGLCRSAFADPDASVGPAELEIASLHLRAPGWADALAGFARSGGFAGQGLPLPPQPTQVLWGEQDRVLGANDRRAVAALFPQSLVAVPRCGHLPHLDQPKLVRDHWCDPVASLAPETLPSEMLASTPTTPPPPPHVPTP